VIDVSDNSYVANVITTILSLRHTSLLVSDLVLSSNNPSWPNSAVTSTILDKAYPLEYFDHLNGAA
jgi:hypothetical protein